MSSGPMFRREYHASSRTRRPYVFRTIVALVLGAMTLLVAFVISRGGPAETPVSARLTMFGNALFVATIVLELIMLAFLIPAHVGGCVAEEREKDTLTLLLLTRLSPIEIVATKAFGRWLSALDPILIGLPILVAAAWVAGLEFEWVLASLALFSCAGLMVALTILASSRREQVGSARAEAVLWIFGWMLGPPLLSVMPVSSGTLWGDLLAELKFVCGYLAPSSPLSLITDRGWLVGSDRLDGRVALMVGLQAAFGILALGLASTHLQARERNPNWTDPTRGYRPPCGDDPIYWREFELPFRRGGGSIFVMRLRLVWILIQALLINLFTMLVTLLSLAVPVGLVVATLYYGSAASRELWANGRGGPTEDRENFNMLIRAATGAIAFLPTLGAASGVAARIASERDKKTWEAFLTTPLGSEEILRSKAWVATITACQSAWPILILWALGLACGVIYPLGVILTAVDLLLIHWASVALGLYLGIRPGTKNRSANLSALGLTATLAFHTPLLFALLCSPREYAKFAAQTPALRWTSILAGLTVATLTCALAWFWTRQAIDRFDEWAGRPRFSGQRPDMIDRPSAPNIQIGSIPVQIE